MVHAANFRKNFIMLSETVYICLPTSSGPEDFTRQSSIPNWSWCNGIRLCCIRIRTKKCHLNATWTFNLPIHLSVELNWCICIYAWNSEKRCLGHFSVTTVTLPWSLHSPTITNYPVFVSEGPRYPPWPYHMWDTSEVNYNIPISSPGT